MTKLSGPQYSKQTAVNEVNNLYSKVSMSRLNKPSNVSSSVLPQVMSPRLNALLQASLDTYRQANRSLVYYRDSVPVYDSEYDVSIPTANFPNIGWHHRHSDPLLVDTSQSQLSAICSRQFLARSPSVSTITARTGPTIDSASFSMSQAPPPPPLPLHEQQSRKLSMQHFYCDNISSRPTSSPPLSRHDVHIRSSSCQRRRSSYRAYESEAIDINSDSMTASPSSATAPGMTNARVHSIMLNKFESDIDCKNRETGGIVLCGGLEVGLQSIYISRVAENSAAQKCDLRSGDQILSANYISFLDGITCKRAYKILHNDGNQFVLLTILPRREAFAPRQRRHHCYAWIDSDGRSVSPPPPDRDRADSDDEPVVRVDQELHSSYRPRIRDIRQRSSSVSHQQLVAKLNSFSSFKRKSSLPSDIREVTITLEKGIDLGLMIRGGIEYGLGIYVTCVEPDSLADKAQLAVGDQILSVNNFDFGEVLHDEAVDILKSSPRLVMKVRFVGKVPSSSYTQMDSSSSNWSPRNSPRYHITETSSSSSNSAISGEIRNFTLPVSPTSIKPSSSPRLSRQSHNQRLTPLSHTKSSPSSSSSSHHHHHSLHQSHSYRDDYFSRCYKRETPTLFITDSDEQNLRTTDSELHDVEDDEDENDELFMLSSDSNKNGVRKRYAFRKRLHNTKSEEEEQIFDELSIKYLNKNERITLAYYRNEYEAKSMTIDAFVALLLELLNSAEKYSILSHLHHVIRQEDVDRFDELVYKREEQAALKSKTLPEAIKFKRFFTKNDSSDSSSYDSPSNETGPNFESLSLAIRGHPSRIRSESAGAVPGHSYGRNLTDLSPPSIDGDHHHDHFDPHGLSLHNSSIQNNSRLSRSECLMPRPSSTFQKQPSPNSAAYRKTFMTRRHSSGASDTPNDHRNHCPTTATSAMLGDPSHSIAGDPFQTNPLSKPSIPLFGSYPTVADERRWSTSVAECRRPSGLFVPRGDNIRRSLSPASGVFTRPEQQRSCEDIETVQQQQQQQHHHHHILAPRTESPNPGQCFQESVQVNESNALVTSAPLSLAPLVSASGTIRGSGNHLHVPNLIENNLSDDNDDEDNQSSLHLRVRRHRSLPSPTFSTEKLLSSHFPQQQRSASFRLPNHRVVNSEPNGRWRIKVKKTKAFLGIAIEGGVNVTTQTQPRIISIHNEGAAVECDELHVGHIILEIDGESTASFNHEQVAQMISRAYYNTPHKDYVEFLVREKNRNEFDLRRSSFMLLNNSFE